MEQSTEVEDSSNNDFSSKENQEARAFLRERFLRVVSSVIGKPCQLYTAENTIVSGEFHGCDKDVINFLIKDLETPVYQIPVACVRATDITNITFHNAEKLTNK
ncbi:gem-associated protein 7 [Nilaparvata lugens]|uniref:gem-associated protein 7 n=1 Tax=Nilaparvata lugens TaxID=108931 RepID=UPI000B98E275|nr:gem-associated protein 7 [Nilaparvata lugens]